MTLRYDTLQSIGAVLAASGKWQHLLAAVDNELDNIRQTAAYSVQTDTILNLASDEYSKSVDQTALGVLRFISPRFEEDRKGIRKVISFSAKRARGAMARWVLECGYTAPNDLMSFDVGGYVFDEETSTAERPVFLRQVK